VHLSGTIPIDGAKGCCWNGLESRDSLREESRTWYVRSQFVGQFVGSLRPVDNEP
jgi:hypothetical protein